MAEKKIVLDVVVESKNSIETLGKLKKDLADLTLQLEDVDKGSDSFKKLTAEINKTEKAISKTEGAFGEASDRLKTLSGGPVERATASFGLLKEGILGLDFGKFKVGIKGATDAFGGLGKAIVATGIGALVLIVVQLIQNFDTLKESGGLVGKVFSAIGDTIEGIKNAAIDLADSLGLIDKDAEQRAKDQEERTKKFIKNEEDKLKTVEGNYNKEIALAKSLGQNTDELEIKSLKAQKAVVDAQIARVQAFQETTSLFDSVLGPLLDKLTKQQEDAALKIELKENEINTRRVENAKKAAEKVKQVTLDELAALADKELADAEKNAKELDALRLRVADESQIEKLQREEQQALEDAERLMASEEDKLNIRKFYASQIAEVEKANADEITQLQKEASNKRKELEKKELEDEKILNQQKLDGVKDTLSTISSLTELFAGKSKASQKKAFDIQKGVSIAQATIATYESATKAFNSLSGIPVVGPVLGVAAAAAAVAAGLANIRKIASQKFDGGGDRSAASTPSLSTNVPSSAQQNVTPQTPNSFALFGTAGTANNLGSNQPQPIQAYVVESDITQTQYNLNKIKSASEL